MPPVLPTYYYRDHFVEMLAFVETTYGSFLDAGHRDFLDRFRALTMPEQCLFIRLANRRGIVFHREALRYAEIAGIDAVISSLMAKGFLRGLAVRDYAEWLRTHSKDTLLLLAARAVLPEVKASWAKPRLIAELHAVLPFEQAMPQAPPDLYVVRDQVEAVQYLLYLYFGRTYRNLTSFALRDLGLIRTNADTAFTARFADAAEAEACFAFSRMIDRLDAALPGAFDHAVAELLADPPAPGDYAASLKGQAAFRAGHFLERRKDHDRALALYRLAPSPESNERAVRLLHATGRPGESRAMIEAMIDDPMSDEEQIFAADFYARKFGGSRIGAYTALLRDSREVGIDDIHRGNPEEGVAAWFRRDGWRVAHTENDLWHSLFGLLFWNELFEGQHARHSGFDRLPHCLRTGAFFALHEASLTATLATIREGRAFTAVLKTYAARQGVENGMLAWDRLDIAHLGDFLHHADGNAVAAILEAMARDFHAMRDGFPDLTLIRDGRVKFAEVKAEGDVIRRNQLARLRLLRNAGFDCEIVRVAYRPDPDQVYVVVDIETTGGRSGADRITEIGAVKLRGGAVIGEWHSLIDPQRPIPAFITQLTGISNVMVAGAPLFGEIADDFATFTADAIFVAHNVNFDYGFIAREYERLGAVFRRPKLCTCAGMRRHYPGHASYGLANLCGLYGLALDSHHRALCDARAATGLLRLINRKRQPGADAAAEPDRASG